MRRKIRKLFWAWDFDKEEKWLNEMAAKGLALVSVSLFTYYFEASVPGEYEIRLELLKSSPLTPQNREYIGFIEDTGAEYIGSVARWVYFRKKTADSGFDLFSDIDSRLKHYNRILLFIGIVGLYEMIFGGTTVLSTFPDFNNIKSFGGMACLMLGLLIGYGFLRVLLKKHNLKKERILHE